jgi:hypothetical protein
MYSALAWEQREAVRSEFLPPSFLVVVTTVCSPACLSAQLKNPMQDVWEWPIALEVLGRIDPLLQVVCGAIGER